MRVFYELDKDDIRKIIAEKYEISADKIEFQGHGEYVGARIDMSATETPGKNPDPKEEVINIPVPDPEPQEETYAFPAHVVADNELTDEHIKDMIEHNVTVAALCRHYGFTQQTKYRLYKRFERVRSELASFDGE